MEQPNIASLRRDFASELANVKTSADLEALRVRFLGKKSPIQQLMQTLRQVAPEERPLFGQQINDLKNEIADQITQTQEQLAQREDTLRFEKEAVDVTLPGWRQRLGNKHLISRTIDDCIDIFTGLGFSVQYGPDIDTEYYNFDALNMPEDHPARDMQDTFYIAPHVLLRTHTTNVQMRMFEKQRPPLRLIAPGKVYRNESISSRSHVFFHQLDGCYVDQGVSFSDLLYTLKLFLQRFFEKDVEVRFRPSFFPFVEPGLEVDIGCLSCHGQGCHLCKQAGWLEILGAGMIHPEVLANGGIDPEVYTGYAWGMGIERLVMLKYGIKDIRLFTQNNIKFLNQFVG